MKSKVSTFSDAEMVKIHELVDFSLSSKIASGVPFLSHIKFLSEIFKDSMTLGEFESVISILDGGDEHHWVDFGILRSASLSEVEDT